MICNDFAVLYGRSLVSPCTCMFCSLENAKLQPIGGRLKSGTSSCLCISPHTFLCFALGNRSLKLINASINDIMKNRVN